MNWTSLNRARRRKQEATSVTAALHIIAWMQATPHLWLYWAVPCQSGSEVSTARAAGGGDGHAGAGRRQRFYAGN